MAEPKKGKGCLIAGIIAAVVVVILALLAIWGIRAFAKKADEVVSSFSSAASEATSLPTDPATPSADTPDPTGTAPVTGTIYNIGDGFTVGEVSVASGWTLETDPTLDWTTIEGMTVTSGGTSTWWVRAVDAGGVQLDETFCTSIENDPEAACAPSSRTSAARQASPSRPPSDQPCGPLVGGADSGDERDDTQVVAREPGREAEPYHDEVLGRHDVHPLSVVTLGPVGVRGQPRFHG